MRIPRRLPSSWTPPRAPRSLVLLVLPALLAAAPVLAAEDDGPREVIVTNLPEVQRIEGEVRLADPPPPPTAFWRRSDVIVPPVDRSSPASWTAAGTIDVDGYSHVVLSLRGVVQGRAPGAGTVGAILVPDRSGVLEALDEGALQFPLEVTATATSDGPAAFHFASAEPERRPLAFPRYRVLLYNTTGRAVTAELFAYLSR